MHNTRFERTRHERAAWLSCVGEPLNRSVSWLTNFISDDIFPKGARTSMLRKVGLQALTVCLVLFFSSSELTAQKRISFRHGTSSATVRAKIGAGGYTEYVVNGRAGQVMSIEITSGNGKVVVNAGTASGRSFSLDMTGGDHLLSIVNTGQSPTSYTLKVSIK